MTVQPQEKGDAPPFPTLFVHPPFFVMTVRNKDPNTTSIEWESIVPNALGSAGAGIFSRKLTHPLGE